MSSQYHAWTTAQQCSREEFIWIHYSAHVSVQADEGMVVHNVRHLHSMLGRQLKGRQLKGLVRGHGEIQHPGIGSCRQNC